MKNLQHKAYLAQPQSITLGLLAEKTNSVVHGDPNTLIKGVGTLANANDGEISFLASANYKNYLKETKSAAVILTSEDVKDCPVPALICENPKLVFAQAVQILYAFQTVSATIHPSAVIDEDGEIHTDAHIGPHCVIGKRVKIAKNVILQSGCVVSDDCEIQENTVLYPNVTIYHGVKIGRDCTIHSGVVIGSDGFGFAKHNSKWIKVPQVGAVVIGDRVEIGANTTIDRGAIENTEIGNDVILDNLIQVGHNVKIGEGTAIAAQCAIAGSATIGKHCMIGGGTCVIGHIHITDFVNIVGSSNVGQSILKPGAYASGITTNEIKTWKRNLVRFHQLESMAIRIRNLEKMLKSKEEA